MSLDQHRSLSCSEQATHFCPELASWVREARINADADRRRGFPASSLQELSVLEYRTDIHRAHPLEYFVALACCDLTTAFIMTQRHAAIRRLESSRNPRCASEWLPEILSGRAFATVGISQLTTSRRHWKVPPVTLRWEGDVGTLEGEIPWVTGAPFAKHIVAGAVDAIEPKAQYLVMLELPASGVLPGPGMQLLALTESCTDGVRLSCALVDRSKVLHGPHEDVMTASNSGGAGGLQTSALAIGLAASAIDYIADESTRRPSLADHALHLQEQWQVLYRALLDPSASREANRLRKGANDLAMAAAHAALSSAKGAGFVEGHPVGRWCQESLFFLVWSCPPMVSDAHLCSFSGWRA
jgi:alkylation response protein AidB-like acyl-CoA dehydrogenase